MKRDKRDAVIVGAVRSPIGKREKALSSLRPDEMAAQVLNALVERVGIPHGDVEDIVMGCSTPTGEQGFNGVYRYNPDGSITLVRGDMVRPNGLAFSPDESLLYVDDSRGRHVLAFPVNPDKTLRDPKVLIDMDVPETGNPDGMKVDSQGNLYVTAAGGLWVVDPAGQHLGTIAFPQRPANLAFGGPDYKTIYATARSGLYSIRVNVPGLPVF